MSKLYEALSKAERERLAEKKKGRRGAGTVGTGAGTLERRQDFSTETNAERKISLAAPSVAISTQDRLYSGSKPSSSNGAVGTSPTAFAAGVQHTWNPDLSALPVLQSRGRELEQFRILRSRLYGFRDAGPLKSILVSSGLAGEGKSFVAANLALTLSRHRSDRVLLIDADLRRGVQHKVFGAPQKPGLAEYLKGRAGIHEVLQRGKAAQGTAPLPDSLPPISFLSVGSSDDRSGDLSGSAGFADLMAELKLHFEWIIVDSSPVSLVSDAVNLARSCDGVLLVARAGVTKFAVAQRAVSEFRASRVLGFVLNGTDDSSATYGYYGAEGADPAKK